VLPNGAVCAARRQTAEITVAGGFPPGAWAECALGTGSVEQAPGPFDCNLTLAGLGKKKSAGSHRSSPPISRRAVPLLAPERSAPAEHVKPQSRSANHQHQNLTHTLLISRLFLPFHPAHPSPPSRLLFSFCLLLRAAGLRRLPSTLHASVFFLRPADVRVCLLRRHRSRGQRNPSSPSSKARYCPLSFGRRLHRQRRFSIEFNCATPWSSTSLSPSSSAAQGYLLRAATRNIEPHSNLALSTEPRAETSALAYARDTHGRGNFHGSLAGLPAIFAFLSPQSVCGLHRWRRHSRTPYVDDSTTAALPCDGHSSFVFSWVAYRYPYAPLAGSIESYTLPCGWLPTGC